MRSPAAAALLLAALALLAAFPAPAGASDDHFAANLARLEAAWLAERGAPPSEDVAAALRAAAEATRHVTLVVGPAPEHATDPHAGEVWSFNFGFATPAPLTPQCFAVRLPSGPVRLASGTVATPNGLPVVDVPEGVHVAFTEYYAGLAAFAGFHDAGQHVGSNCVNNSGWGSTVIGVGAFDWS